MSAKGSYGSANRVLRRHDVLIGECGITDRNSRRAGRSAAADVKSMPAKIVKIQEADFQKTGFWSSVLDFLTEGFALCAASSYPAIFPPLEPHPEEEIPTVRDVALGKWRGSKHQISSMAGQSAPLPGSDRDTGQAAPDTSTTFTHRGRREPEREIEEAVAALSRLDDRTLQMLGIPHRSQIEQTVRYCHDC
jgi:hypothetical protein